MIVQTIVLHSLQFLFLFFLGLLLSFCSFILSNLSLVLLVPHLCLSLQDPLVSLLPPPPTLHSCLRSRRRSRNFRLYSEFPRHGPGPARHRSFSHSLAKLPSLHSAYCPICPFFLSCVYPICTQTLASTAGLSVIATDTFCFLI